MTLNIVALALSFLVAPAFTGTPGFRVMGNLANEYMWGGMFLGTSLYRIYSILTWKYWHRITATTINLFLCVFLCLSFVVSLPTSSGVWLFGMWALVEIWILLRIQQ